MFIIMMITSIVTLTTIIIISSSSSYIVITRGPHALTSSPAMPMPVCNTHRTPYASSLLPPPGRLLVLLPGTPPPPVDPTLATPRAGSPAALVPVGTVTSPPRDGPSSCVKEATQGSSSHSTYLARQGTAARNPSRRDKALKAGVASND